MNTHAHDQLGGWSIEESLLRCIHDMLPSNKTILEFGSGSGTDALLKRYQVISEGIFHTVWKRQEDGSWKYVWD